MRKTVVVKIGGSLLRRPDFSEAMTGWFQTTQLDFPTNHLLAVVGGGELVDQLRVMSARHRLSEQAAHWLAIELMAVNLRLVASLLPGIKVVDSLADFRRRHELPGLTLLDVRKVLRFEEPAAPGRTLEPTWRTTSDSIAARLAAMLSAELVLLKEALPPEAWRPEDWSQLASLGLVDASFPAVAAGISSIKIERLSG